MKRGVLDYRVSYTKSSIKLMRSDPRDECVRGGVGDRGSPGGKFQSTRDADGRLPDKDERPSQRRQKQQPEHDETAVSLSSLRRETHTSSLSLPDPDTPQKSRRSSYDESQQRETTGGSVHRRLVPSGSATRRTASITAASSFHNSSQQQQPGAPHQRRASAPFPVPSSSGTFSGNFDDSRYWDFAFRLTHKGDMGHHCRECKKPFSVLSENIAVRRLVSTLECWAESTYDARRT